MTDSPEMTMTPAFSGEAASPGRGKRRLAAFLLACVALGGLLLLHAISRLPASSTHQEALAVVPYPGLLLAAVEAKNVETIESLLLQGVDIDWRDRFGNSALSIAVGLGDPGIVRFLLSAGADPNPPRNLDQNHEAWDTPLMIAVRNNDRIITEMLLDAGANLLLENAAGESALTLAKGDSVAALVGDMHAQQCDIPIRRNTGPSAHYWDKQQQAAQRIVHLSSSQDVLEDGDLLIFREDPSFVDPDDMVDKIYNILTNYTSHSAIVQVRLDAHGDRQIYLIEGPSISLEQAIEDWTYLPAEKEAFGIPEARVEELRRHREQLYRLNSGENAAMTHDEVEDEVSDLWWDEQDTMYERILRHREAMSPEQQRVFYRELKDKKRQFKLNKREYDILRIRKDYPGREDILAAFRQFYLQFESIDYGYDVFANELYREVRGDDCISRGVLCEERLNTLRQEYLSGDVPNKYCSEITTDAFALAGIGTAFPAYSSWTEQGLRGTDSILEEYADASSEEQAEAIEDAIENLVLMLTEEMEPFPGRGLVDWGISAILRLYATRGEGPAKVFKSYLDRLHRRYFGVMVWPEDLRNDIFVATDRRVFDYVGTHRHHRCFMPYNLAID